MEKFYAYSFEDFLNDPSFGRFVKGVVADDTLIWQRWLDTHPGNLETYTDARAAVLALHSVKLIRDTAVYQDEVWNRIENTIEEKERQKGRIFRLNLIRVAAAAALLLFGGLTWYYNSKINISTGYGEQRLVSLPDGSVVRLNANSTLSYWRAWQWHDYRETWLRGEALFNVLHLNKNKANILPSERFCVHAGITDIRVLGTVFNVRYRREKMLVSLIKGSIHVSQKGEAGNGVTLKAGEAVIAEHQQLRRQVIARLSNQPTAWTNSAMETRNISVSEIIEYFEDTYGGRIVVNRPELLRKHIDGHISLESAENTLNMLANLLNANVEKRDSVYYLKSK